MWPDWAIFESSWGQISYKSSPNVEQHFWAVVNNGIFSENCCGYFLGQLLDDFRQLFSPTSGHTGANFQGIIQQVFSPMNVNLKYVQLEA